MQSKKFFFYKTQPLNVLLNYNEYLCAFVSAFFCPVQIYLKNKISNGKSLFEQAAKIGTKSNGTIFVFISFSAFYFASASRSTNLLLDFHFRVRSFGWILRLNFIKSLK